MSSEDLAIKVENVSMYFEIYARPSDQLKQYLLPRLQRSIGLTPRQYFQPFMALDNISFEVKKGESVGIIGRNGSGKSTLLQIITGTLSPTAGQVYTNGRIAALLELGSGFNPEFTGRENVYLNGALLGLSRAQIDQRFDAIAAFADIGKYLDQPVKTYSSGMLVRLAFAVQVQVEPDILIIDEALAVGDSLFQKKCYRKIESLIDRGVTFLLVSHEQESIRNLTGKSLYLDAGKLQSYGNSADVLFAYRESLQKLDELSFQSIGANKTPSKNRAYGNLLVEVISVEIMDACGNPAKDIYAGDLFSIEIKCVAHVNITNINIAYRIRSKQGIKVITWGTLNEDMRLESHDNTFWRRQFVCGEIFSVSFEGVCRLSADLYEVEAIAALEYDRYYRSQRILHWIDGAAHFNVHHHSEEYVFDGIADIGLRSRFISLDRQD